MTGDRDRELRELIALAAVGALDAGERRALDAQIAGRPDLVAELAELQAVAATLADAAAEAPPEQLRARVLDSIADVPQLPTLDGGLGAVGPRSARPDPLDRPAPGPSAAAPPAAEVIQLASRRRRWAPLAAAAAVLALVAGGVLARTLTTDDAVDLAAVVADDEAVTYRLDGAISSMRLVHSIEHDAMALVGEDVPMPPGDQVYELWLITAGEPQRVDIFRPHDDGSVEILMVDMAMPDDAVFAVTVEPAGGTEVPTGDVVAATA